MTAKRTSRRTTADLIPSSERRVNRARKAVTPAERESRRVAAAEKVAALSEQLETAVAALDNDTRWVEVLDTIAAFGAKYSWSNQLLILAQCEDRGFEPRMVQAFNAWRNAGHPVRKGERGIAIFAPVMRKLSADEIAERGGRIPAGPDGRSLAPQLVGWTTVPVFDVSQVTDPETVVIPEPTVRARRVAVSGPRPELLTGSDPTGALADVEKIVKHTNLDLAYVDPSVLGSANGRTDGETIEVRNDVDDAQKIKTLVHEWAHNYCGHVGPFAARRGELTRGQRECEAEATAYVVCGALGLDTGSYSAPYVNGWSAGDPEIIKTALGKVAEAAKVMLAALTPDAVGAS